MPRRDVLFEFGARAAGFAGGGLDHRLDALAHLGIPCARGDASERGQTCEVGEFGERPERGVAHDFGCDAALHRSQREVGDLAQHIRRCGAGVAGELPTSARRAKDGRPSTDSKGSGSSSIAGTSAIPRKTSPMIAPSGDCASCRAFAIHLAEGVVSGACSARSSAASQASRCAAFAAQRPSPRSGRKRGRQRPIPGHGVQACGVAFRRIEVVREFLHRGGECVGQRAELGRRHGKREQPRQVGAADAEMIMAPRLLAARGPQRLLERRAGGGRPVFQTLGRARAPSGAPNSLEDRAAAARAAFEQALRMPAPQL